MSPQRFISFQRLDLIGLIISFGAVVISFLWFERFKIMNNHKRKTVVFLNSIALELLCRLKIYKQSQNVTLKAAKG
jgi:hypothetical protein